MEFGQVEQRVCGAGGGGAVNVQDSSTENKPACGKREEGGRERRGGREEEEEGKQPLNGDRRGKESPFQWNKKNCAMSTRSAQRLLEISAFSGSIFSPPPPRLLSRGSSHSATIRAVIWRPDVQGDARATHEWIRHALPIGESLSRFSKPGLRPVCVCGVDVCAQSRCH